MSIFYKQIKQTMIDLFISYKFLIILFIIFLQFLIGPEHLIKTQLACYTALILLHKYIIEKTKIESIQKMYLMQGEGVIGNYFLHKEKIKCYSEKLYAKNLNELSVKMQMGDLKNQINSFLKKDINSINYFTIIEINEKKYECKVKINKINSQILLISIHEVDNIISLIEMYDFHKIPFAIVEKETTIIHQINKEFLSTFNLKKGERLDKYIDPKLLNCVESKVISAFYIESEVLIACHKSVKINAEQTLLYITIKFKCGHKNDESLINIASIPIFKFNEYGKILSTNNAFKLMFNEIKDYKEENIFNIIRITKTNHCNERSPKKYEEMPLPKYLNTTYEIKLKNNSEFVGALNATPDITNDSKNFIGYIFDITEYKKLEAHYNHSQKIKAIGELAGGIAHDFNNIMTAILGFCDLLLIQHSVSSPSFDSIEQIKQNSIRATRLVKQLLAFSRKQIMQPKIIDITDNLLDLSNNFIQRIIGENIKLKLNLDPDQWAIKIDPAKLDQIIINLVVNAKDAMNGTGILTIKTSNIRINTANDFSNKYDNMHKIDSTEITPGDYVLIEIGDTGHGIQKELIDKIFDPFFSTKKAQGTGLGLSTVYGTVKQSNGNIFIKTKLNEGTTFFLLFKREEKNISCNAQDKDIQTQRISDLTGTDTVLIVEDELAVRMVCAQALRNKGYKVIDKELCSEAIEVVKKTKIDIILSDVIMQEMSGVEMVNKIKETNPKIKVVFMSGYTEEDTLAKSNYKYKMLLKPFTLQQLATTIKQASLSTPLPSSESIKK